MTRRHRGQFRPKRGAQKQPGSTHAPSAPASKSGHKISDFGQYSALHQSLPSLFTLRFWTFCYLTLLFMRSLPFSRSASCHGCRAGRVRVRWSMRGAGDSRSWQLGSACIWLNQKRFNTLLRNVQVDTPERQGVLRRLSSWSAWYGYRPA
jgi:hypothetical protein